MLYKILNNLVAIPADKLLLLLLISVQKPPKEYRHNTEITIMWCMLGMEVHVCSVCKVKVSSY